MIQRPKGTKDVLPEESYIWQNIESKLKNIFTVYGYNEIRVPVFEHTELFQRGVGDTTDVVQKNCFPQIPDQERRSRERPEYGRQLPRRLRLPLQVWRSVRNPNCHWHHGRKQYRAQASRECLQRC